MYPELIKTICSSLSGIDDCCPDLTIVPIHYEMQADERGRPLGNTFEIPDTLIPNSFQAHFLPGDQSFLDGVKSLLAETSPQTVFAVPPWIQDRHLGREFRRDHQRLGFIEAFVVEVFNTPESTEVQLELGNPSPPPQAWMPDVLILLVPRAFLTSMKQGRWLTGFLTDHSAVIIEHSHALNIPGLHQQVQLATLVLLKEPGPLRFFKITEEMVSENAEQVLGDLSTLLMRQGGSTEFGYVYRGELTPDYPTTYDFYSPTTEALRESVKDLSTKVSLAEVAGILLGFSRPSPHMGAPPEELFEFITGRNITTEGNFDFSDLRRMEPDQPVGRIRFLEEGDICVRRIRQPHDRRQFTAAVFLGFDQPLTFDQSVIVIRPKPTLNEEQRLILFEFLRSSVARDLFIAKGEGIHLQSHVLREFPVPLADKDLITAVRGLNEARQGFADWTTKLEKDLSNLVSDRDMAQSRMNLLSAGQLARQRYRAARQVEDLDYRIRTQYPLPLAYLWRDWQVSSTDPYIELRNILKAGESFTCFFALVAILVGRSCNVKIGYLEVIAARLNERGGGTNFGDWFAILEEVGRSKKFRQLQSDVPFFEVTELMRSKESQQALQLLMATRNDDSHGRIKPGSVSRGLLGELEAALKTIYTNAGFVGDYGLLQVNQARFDAIRRETNYNYSDLTGDNPLAPKRKAITMQTELEVNSLYLRDRQDHLHLFRPLLHYLECPECHLMSTFYLDTYSGSGPNVGLKSFERNSVREEKFAEEFRWSGLLQSEVNET